MTFDDVPSRILPSISSVIASGMSGNEKTGTEACHDG